MKNTRKIMLLAALVAGTLGTTAALARDNVDVQIRIGGLGLALPLPPLPPLPHIVVREEPRVVVREEPRVIVREAPFYRYARWDADGDGIPNRYDRYPLDPRNGRGWNERRDRDHRDDRHDDRHDRRDDHDGYRR